MIFQKTKQHLHYFKADSIIYDIFGGASKICFSSVQSSLAYLSGSQSSKFQKTTKGHSSKSNKLLITTEDLFPSPEETDKSANSVSFMYFCCLQSCPFLQDWIRSCQMETEQDSRQELHGSSAQLKSHLWFPVVYSQQIHNHSRVAWLG